MSLTPLQEIFILLEDEKEVPLYRINKWGNQARGVLSKLIKSKFIEKSSNNGDTTYKITQKGEKQFDNDLKPLKTTGRWDGKWRLVIFNLPENKRDVRDKLRRYLVKLGLGIMQNSVWITPNDVRGEIECIQNKLNINEKIRYFEISRNTSIDNTIIAKAWNLPELEDKYKKFSFEAERLIKVIDKDPNPRFRAKKMIYQYSMILKEDPMMPNEFRQKDALRQKSRENYLMLRKYII